jgi:AcrR family transcriptional regulator
MPPLRKPKKAVVATADRLLEAAANEFNEHGYWGTDSNKIARRAGFAPQTFYRWFDDKVDIFVKTYERWVLNEFDVVSKLLAKNANDVSVARAIVAQHRSSLVFRRSLRLLSLENAVVRAARAQSRLRQIVYLKALHPRNAREDSSLAAMLLQTERLADALAENEFGDMHLDSSAGEQALAQLIHDLRMR